MASNSNNNRNNKFLAISFFAFAFFASHGAFADEKNTIDQYTPTCGYLTLVTKFINGTDNTTSCVDAPVSLGKTKVVFNLGEKIEDSSGRPIGLRHMYMLGTSLKMRIRAGLLDPDNVSIIGVMHGSALNWALTDSTTSQAEYFMEQIFALKNAGVNINLEVCGVTLQGRGKTNADLYQSDNGMIHVDQGAVGRVIDLEQRGYVYFQE